MRWYWATWLVFLLVIGTGCRGKAFLPDRPTAPIVVLFENDVHCAVDGYARLSGLRKQQMNSTPYVTVVSCGDFLQGDIVGSASQGKSLIEIMNRVSYDVVTLGNHEFDYGLSPIFHLADSLEATVVCSNFRNTRTRQLPFQPYQIIRYGEVDIAYIGFTTTTTAVEVSPVTFRDSVGNIVYDFALKNFYEHAQHYINEARTQGADYVVALTHLGDKDRGIYPNSLDFIAHTRGVDVVLDGHEHRAISDTLVNNQKGTPVLLASTDGEFKQIGMLTLSPEGFFHSRLIPTQADSIPTDWEVHAWVSEIKERVKEAGRRVVGTSTVEMPFYIAEGNRSVRNASMALGNFCADAFRIMLGVDVAMINGGGIRASLPQGEITYNDLLSIFPFQNTATTARMTGQELLDALEFSVSSLPEEDGSFMQVSGMRFDVDASVPTPVVIDEDHLFSHVGEGQRRVSNLQILNKQTGKYEPIELSRNYLMASFDYQIVKMGCSGIFRYASVVDNNLGMDVDILEAYIVNVLHGRIGSSYRQTEKRIRF